MSASLSILIVEDESDLLGEITRYLERRGHAVRTAESFTGGQDLIDSAIDPDVLITDVRMPGGNGLDLARRAQQRHPRCRIIIMTGHLDQEQLGAADSIGAAAMLFKPFSFSRLLAVVAGEDAAGQDSAPDASGARAAVTSDAA